MERETGIEPAPSAWKAEVLPLNYSRAARLPRFPADDWWREVDSNHRRRKPADLQSAPVGRLGIPPVVEDPVKQPVILEVPRGPVNAFRTSRRESAPAGPAGSLPAPPGDYTLKRKCRTSPSWTRYSLPSRRSRPASRAPASPR